MFFLIYENLDYSPPRSIVRGSGVAVREWAGKQKSVADRPEFTALSDVEAWLLSPAQFVYSRAGILQSRMSNFLIFL